MTLVADDPFVLDEAPAPPARFTYRDYQQECCAAVTSAWEEFKRVFCVIPTGGGKTIIFTHLAREEVAAGGRVLILAHTEELLDQAADKLEASTGLPSAREKGSSHAGEHERIVVASVQTLCRDERLRGWRRDHFSLVIVDECHRSLAVSYLKILNHFDAKVLGVTATPDRGDKKNLAEFYEHMAFQFTLLDAVRAGWLVRPRVHEIKLEIDLMGVKTSRTAQGSDLDLSEVSHRIAPLLHNIGRQIVANTVGRGQGIVFLPSIATAAQLADSLNHFDPGSAEYVSGDCPDRAEKIAAFKAGKIRRLCNAMLLLEGFDHDAVDWLSVLRPTKIRSLYAQAVGRGLRPLTSIVPRLNASRDPKERCAIIAASSKPDIKILDFLWLTDSLDLVSPYQLVAKSSAVAEKMRSGSPLMQGDLIDLEAEAERDLLASIEKAMSKGKKKKARVIDPLELAVTLHDDEIANYEPSSRWEFRPPSPDQVKLLAEYGVDSAKVPNAGLAFKIITKAKLRAQQGLCTFRQMNFFERLGVKERERLGINDVAFITAADANKHQRAKFSRWAHKKARPS